MKAWITAALTATLATTAGGAAAADGALGSKGSVALHVATGSPMLVSGDLGFFGGQSGATPTLGLQTNRYTDREDCNNVRCVTDRTSVTALYLNPRVHYFVIDNLSVGGELLVASFSGETETETRALPSGATQTVTTKLEGAPGAFGLMPTVGYNVALGERFSLWPQGGIGFRRATWSVTTRDYAERWWFLNVDVPVLFHVAPHFDVGVGPGLTLTLAQSRDVPDGSVTFTYSGYSTTIVRWFNAHVVGTF